MNNCLFFYCILESCINYWWKNILQTWNKLQTNFHRSVFFGGNFCGLIILIILLQKYFRNVRRYRKKIRARDKRLYKYKTEDVLTDRAILRSLIPGFVEDMNRYQTTLCMTMCVRREMAPVWQLGLKQAFTAL